MSARIGVDVFLMERMAAALKENNPHYFNAVFAPREQAEAARHTDACVYYATRFALKEAAFKALNTAWTEAMEWNQIITSGTEHEAPRVQYTGPMKQAADAAGVVHLSSSVSSDGGLAFAAVVATIADS